MEVQVRVYDVKVGVRGVWVGGRVEVEERLVGGRRFR